MWNHWIGNNGLSYSRGVALASFALIVQLVVPWESKAVPQEAEIVADQKISSTAGGLVENLGAADRFGISTASLGDLDGDGFGDIAVGALEDDNGGFNRGAIYVLLLNQDSTVKSEQKISDTTGDPGDHLTLANGGQFGRSISLLGDYDGDGAIEIAVGAHRDGAGAVWILDLDPSTLQVANTPARPVYAFKVASGSAGFTTLDAADDFGVSVANLGDWDGDGAPELGVGALGDDVPSESLTNSGALYVLYLDPDPDAAAIKSFTKLDADPSNPTALESLATFDASGDTWFGQSAIGVGDLDGDGQADLAVGAGRRGANGAVWLLLLDPGCSLPATCQVGGFVEITEGSGGFSGPLLGGGEFGSALGLMPEVPGIQPPRLLVGAPLPESGRGQAWVMELGAQGVSGARSLRTAPGWSVIHDTFDHFGSAVSGLGDRDGDGQANDWVVGAEWDDDGASTSGAVHTATLSPCTRIVTNAIVFHSPADDGEDPFCIPTAVVTGMHTLHLYLGAGDVQTANPADVCKDGLGEGDEVCALDVRFEFTGGFAFESFTPSLGDMRTNSPLPGATEFRVNWIGAPPAGPPGPVKLGDLVFDVSAPTGMLRVAQGSAAVSASLALEDIPEHVLAVPMPEPGRLLGAGATALLVWSLARRRRRGSARGPIRAVLVAGLTVPLALSPPDRADAGPAIESETIISNGNGGLAFGDVPSGSGFGWSFALIGDVDGDGNRDLAVGAPEETFSPTGPPGRVSIVFLDENGSALGIETVGPPPGAYDYGWAVDNLGDLDGDGISDLIVGDPAADTLCGAAHVVLLTQEGTAKSHIPIGPGHGGIPDLCESFGHGVTVLGDVDGDGQVEVAVGAIGADTNGPNTNTGAVYILSLSSSGSVTWWEKFEDDAPFNLAFGAHFGEAVQAIGDLDGDGLRELAVLSEDWAQVYIIFLASPGPGQVEVSDHVIRSCPISSSGLDSCTGSMGWIPVRDPAIPPGAPEQTGVLLLPTTDYPLAPTPEGGVYAVRLGNDGYPAAHFKLCPSCGVGLVHSTLLFGGIATIGDIDGDEVPDLVVGDTGYAPGGAAIVLQMIDTDHDGFFDGLDNCGAVYNPLQVDADDDGVGDLCDNCAALANANQADGDGDGEGDVCEPVEVQLVTTGTPAAPSWDLSLQCGAFDLAQVHGAIVLPAGATNPKALTLSGTSIGAGSGSSGPGLVSPSGVRADAIYFSAFGNGSPDNRLCSALDPPIQLGTLTTGAIGGTQLAAAALSEEGVGVPGFGLALASDAGGAIPLSEIRLVNGIPLPILDLELGPAVETASGTKWEVRVTRANDEFHRIAFGLIAPAGTTTGGMRWLGCDTTPDGNGARACCESPPCGDFDGLGVGTNVNPNRAFTVGPQASPPGTQVPHTMYVVLEGSALSNGTLDTVNPAAEGQFHVLGEVELSSSPDLEPALTVDGANDIDDLFSAGTVDPLVDVSTATRDIEEVKLIGAFNPADDVDGDGIQDLGDNCPFEPNSAQSNRGSFLDATDDSNALGDACECAEATDDGAVLDPDDFDEIRDYLSGAITNPVTAAEIEARCSVAGTPECNIRDLVFLQQAIAAGNPNVEVRCDAALSPIPPTP